MSSLNFGKSIFPPSKDNIVSYDFQDIASGQGIKEFTLFRTIDTYALSSALVYSSPGYSIATGTTSASYVKVLDVDFDVVFRLPQTVDGTAVLNIPFGFYNNYSNASDTYITAKIRHWDGTTETDIVSNDSKVYTVTAEAVSNVLRMAAIDLLCPRTHFKKGETLRVTIEQWLKCADTGGGSTGMIAHDPKNRSVMDDSANFGTAPTVALIQVPFDLKL